MVTLILNMSFYLALALRNKMICKRVNLLVILLVLFPGTIPRLRLFTARFIAGLQRFHETVIKGVLAVVGLFQRVISVYLEGICLRKELTHTHQHPPNTQHPQLHRETNGNVSCASSPPLFLVHLRRSIRFFTHGRQVLGERRQYKRKSKRN